MNSFVGLYTYDKDGKLVPALSDGEPEISEDKTTYTFKLIESKWSDGSELTAKDFAYSWNRAAAEATASDYSYLFDVIDKNDDGTLMDFDYIELIKKLFINEKPQIIFDNIEEEDQEKINEMYEKICKQAQLDDDYIQKDEKTI